EFAAHRVDVGHAGGALAGTVEIDAQDLAARAQLEIVAPEQCGEYAGLRARLGIVAAAEPLAVAAVRALPHLHAVDVLVRLRRIGGRAGEWMKAGFACGL